MILMSVEEAEKGPAGLGREEPDALPEPKYVIVCVKYHSYYVAHMCIIPMLVILVYSP